MKIFVDEGYLEEGGPRIIEAVLRLQFANNTCGSGIGPGNGIVQWFISFGVRNNGAFALIGNSDTLERSIKFLADKCLSRSKRSAWLVPGSMVARTFSGMLINQWDESLHVTPLLLPPPKNSLGLTSQMRRRGLRGGWIWMIFWPDLINLREWPSVSNYLTGLCKSRARRQLLKAHIHANYVQLARKPSPPKTMSHSSPKCDGCPRTRWATTHAVWEELSLKVGASSVKREGIEGFNMENSASETDFPELTKSQRSDGSEGNTRAKSILRTSYWRKSRSPYAQTHKDIHHRPFWLPSSP